MVNRKYKWICVNSEFHKQLKREAADEGKSIIEYTEDLTRKVNGSKNKKLFDWRMI